MMGTSLSDPQGIESDIRQLPGLGLLPVNTILEGEKITKQVSFTFGKQGIPCTGYEIHNGRTEAGSPDCMPLNILENGTEDGCILGNCLGTYIHGILDNAAFVEYLIKPFLNDGTAQTTFDYQAFKEEQYDKLAAHVRKHVNMELVYAMMKK